MTPVKTIKSPTPSTQRSRASKLASASLAVSLGVIALFTLTPERGMPQRAFSICLVCGTFGTANLFLNGALFVPLGASLRALRSRFEIAAFTCLGITVLVESLQVYLVPGRYPTVGDIAANSVGGMLGWWLASSWKVLAFPNTRSAAVLAGIATAAACVMVAATHFVFAASAPYQPYYGQIAPQLRNMDPVDGVVSKSMVNDTPVTDGRLSASASQAIGELMEKDSLTLGATVLMSGRSPRRGSVLRLVNSNGEELAFLLMDGPDAAFSARTRAADLGLRQPGVVLPAVIPCDSCPHRIGQLTTLRAGRYGSRLAISAERASERLAATTQISQNMGWVAFSPVPIWQRWQLMSGTLLVVFLLYAVGSYWFGSSTSSTAQGLLFSGASVILSQLAIAVAAGRSLSPLPVELATIVVAVVLGSRLASKARRFQRLPPNSVGSASRP